MATFNSRMLRAAAGACLVASSFAAPTNVEREAITAAAVVPRATSAAISNQSQLDAAFSSFSADAQFPVAAASVFAAILTQIVPAPGPTSIAQAQKELQTINQANPNDIFKSGAEILLNGLAGDDYVNIFNSYTIESNPVNPFNPPPPRVIYPKAEADDAPYDLSEQQLRQVIYIPPTFTYGKVRPVIFLPGTGAIAGQNFGPNYGKLFKQANPPIADPVYLNLPSFNLNDIQQAAEYTAYAINYISAITKRNDVSRRPHPTLTSLY